MHLEREAQSTPVPCTLKYTGAMHLEGKRTPVPCTLKGKGHRCHAP
jgi:hypothetical protein